MNALRVTMVIIIIALFGAIFGVWQWKTNHKIGMPQVESRWDRNDGDQKPVGIPQKSTENLISEPPKSTENEPQKPEVFIPRSYKQALDLAKSMDKSLFLYFTSERCEYCAKMQKDTLNDPKVKELLSQYVFYSIDVNGQESYVATGAQIKMVPYYLICTGDRKVLKSGVGYKGIISFINWLQ